MFIGVSSNGQYQICNNSIFYATNPGLSYSVGQKIHIARWNPLDSPFNIFYSASNLGTGQLAASSFSTLNFNGGSSLISIGGLIGSPLQGEVSEVIFYDRNLNTAEINSVNSYLTYKYGVYP
jgi:hypothetical protein